MRRLEAARAISLPKATIPATAKRRRRRNNQPFRIPWKLLVQAAASFRWLSLGLLGLCAFALFEIGADGTFYLSFIPVEGAVSIPASEVVGASGLAGRHIFAVDPGEAAANIGQLPGVVSSTVLLEWPNQVRIQIGEETPVAVWHQSGATYWVNEQGNLLPARSEGYGLLQIYSETDGPEGDLEFVPEEVLNGALQLRELRPNIERLYYRPGEGLSYDDGRGWRAHFGQGLDMQQKLAIYEAIIDDLLERGISPTYVSVSNQDKPHYSANSS